MTEFMVVVVYDISDDKLRRKVENICKLYGLSHIQRSSFVGMLTENLRRELYADILRAIESYQNSGEVSIRIYRIRLADYKQTLRIGYLEGFDRDPSPSVTYYV